MSNYPYGYPDHRLIVDDVDLATEFQLILVDGYELQPPEPKIYTVDIPGGNGVIDLTEALGGDVAFSNRKQRFTFKCIYANQFETTKTKVSNFLHGKRFEYKISWDVEYVYRGRFSIISYSHMGLAKGILGEIVIEIDADPYKYKNDRIFSINGVGGELYHFPSGRKPVRPIVQTSRPTRITWKDQTIMVGIGTYRLNDVLFTEGINDLYINTYEIFYTEWQDVGNNGSHKKTWNEALSYTWDEFQRIGLPVKEPGNNIMTLAASDSTSRTSFFVKAYRWSDLKGYTWNYLKNNKWTWDGVNYNPSPGVDTSDGVNKNPNTNGGQSSSNSGSSSGNTGSGSSGGSTGNSGGSSTGNSKVTDFSDLDFTSTSMYITYEWGDL